MTGAAQTHSLALGPPFSALDDYLLDERSTTAIPIRIGIGCANSQSTNGPTSSPALPTAELPSPGRATANSSACNAGSDGTDDKALEGRSLHTAIAAAYQTTFARSGALGIKSNSPPRVAPWAINGRPSRPGDGTTVPDPNLPTLTGNAVN